MNIDASGRLFYFKKRVMPMAVTAGYIASQNKRWQQANQNNDTDLINRLKADSQRAGYSLSPYNANGSSAYSAALRASRPSAGSAIQAGSTAAATSPAASSVTTPASTIGQPFQFKAPEPFTFNKDTDPNYQAAMQAAKSEIANTQAYLRSRGQGKSSYSETVADQAAAKASTDALANAIEQAYAQYSDQANRDLSVQQANYGVQQDQFNNAVTEGQLTGSYMPAQGREYVNAILSLKNQAEAPGVTAEQRSALSAEADKYRAALRSIGIDPSQLGSGVNASTASTNAGALGVQTLASKQFAYQQARDAIADKQYQQTFDENVRQFGVDAAIQQAQLDHQISSDSAQLALAQDDNDRQWASLDFSMNQASQPGTPTYSGLSTNQVLDNIRNMYTVPVYSAIDLDKNGNPLPDAKPTGSQITTDPAKREQMFLNVVDSNLPSDNDTNQVLTALGFSRNEIAQLKAKYGAGE